MDVNRESNQIGTCYRNQKGLFPKMHVLMARMCSSGSKEEQVFLLPESLIVFLTKYNKKICFVQFLSETSQICASKNTPNSRE